MERQKYNEVDNIYFRGPKTLCAQCMWMGLSDFFWEMT